MKESNFNSSERFLSLLSVCFIIIGGVSCHHNNRIHPPTPPTYAYMTGTAYNSIVSCLVDGTNLESCITTAIPGLNGPSAIAINDGYAFITNEIGDSVTSCAVGNGVLTSCTTLPNSNFNNSLSVPIAIAISNDRAFILNGDNQNNPTITSCIVNGGNLTSCIDSGVTASDISNEANSIAINNGYAFITNGHYNMPFYNEVTSCQINGGTLVTPCTQNTIDPTPLFQYGEGIAIAINNGYAFLLNGESGLIACPINGGSLGTCSATPFTNTYAATAIAFNHGYAYLLSGFFGNSGVTECQANGPTLNDCGNATGNSYVSGISSIAFD